MRLLHHRLSRRSLIKSSAFGGAGVAGLALVGCGNPQEEDAEARSNQQNGDDPPHFPLIEGWYRDRRVRYYDFGANTPLTTGNALLSAPIYALITGFNGDGSPEFVEGQHNIVDVIPGDEGYSDLWEVMLVSAPPDYEPESIRSVEEVMDSGYEIMPAGIFVNCPIVPEGSTLETGQELVQGWYKGEEVYYPDYGPNPPVAIPIFALITGMNDDGSPIFVEGQQNIIDAIPEDPGYSDFWRVNLVTVPEDYEPNSIRSAEDVLASGFPITETDIAVNCPVVEVEEEQMPDPTATATAPAPTATPTPSPDEPTLTPTATTVPPTATPTSAAPRPPQTGSGSR